MTTLITATKETILFRNKRNLNNEIYQMSHRMVSNQEDITAPIEDTSPQQKAQRQFSATKNRLPQFRRLLQCKSC